ncbi:MAG: BrnA antitoxin family protein [Candidatus Binatia bacterium]
MRKPKKKKATSGRFRQVLRPSIYQEEDIAMSNVKINVHIRLDGDVLNYFKEKAKQEGGKYQTLINQCLRAAISKQRSFEDRLDNIEQRLGMQ